MSYLLSSQVTSVDNVEFNQLACSVGITASAGAILPVIDTPTATGVTKNGSNHLVLASGANYMLEASLALYKTSYSNAVVQWYNSTDGVYVGQEALAQCYLWYSSSARVTRFVSRALILDSDITGGAVTVYPVVKSVSSSGATLGLTSPTYTYPYPHVRVWRIS
jgi:hypothetical protein